MRRITGFLTIAALVAAGCGGGGESSGKPAAAALLAAAVKSTEETESNLSEVTMRSTLAGQEMTMDARAVSAADQTRFSLTARYSEAGGEPQRMVMRSIGETAYMRGEIIEGALPRGKRWARITDEDLAAPTMTPSEFLGFLRDNDDVEEVGREEVRGRPAVHIRGPVDVRRFIEESPDSPFAERLRRNPALEDLDMDVDVWVTEDDDRIARMGLVMTVDGTEGELRMDADILEYDVPLDFGKPPADQVVDLGDLGG